MDIRRANRKDAWGILALALQLWPDHETDELFAEISEALEGVETVFFVALDEKALIGFASCALRRDYVEGAATSPVCYLEGICVRDTHRRRGIAKALVAVCEDWARAQGCAEFASDCPLQNQLSILFHHGTGFREANRIVCFLKRL